MSASHFVELPETSEGNSGPLAMVVAGIMTGNRGRARAMSDITRDYLSKFWEVTDEILNAILFLLIGLEIVIVTFEVNYVIIGLLTAI
ncbi:cation:proton antiporter domain-containing protein [Dyadobacter arcticus]|uniref:NhaP-type Na+/H+ or K+/H+ antiporter n=1 Tax=Dyadobacter arcticus TaxID=1078754 RepID=A0ABX0UHM8_9BACT|nr:cation:proton antiporter [Dyadobacter arcticus]NIJ52532.1 NhaP-type Na+/H+ or K+/H+ antiporter [Dyadobacter arcticus]